MTRVTNFGRKRTFHEAGFDNSTGEPSAVIEASEHSEPQAAAIEENSETKATRAVKSKKGKGHYCAVCNAIGTITETSTNR